jgi:hypothetical protein
VYEDDYCLAFRDINPQAPVHYLSADRKRATCTPAHVPHCVARAQECRLRSRGMRSVRMRDFQEVRSNCIHTRLDGVIPKERNGMTQLSKAREDHKAILGHLMCDCPSSLRSSLPESLECTVLPQEFAREDRAASRAGATALTVRLHAHSSRVI